MYREIFVSYSRKNKGLMNDVVRHLSGGTHGMVWSDEDIAVGQEWDVEIGEALADCRMAVLLVSGYWLSSEYILKREVPLIRELRGDGGLVYPVRGGSADWARLPWLAALQWFPREGPVLLELKGHARDRVLAEMAADVRVQLANTPARATRRWRESAIRPVPMWSCLLLVLLVLLKNVLAGADPTTSEVVLCLSLATAGSLYYVFDRFTTIFNAARLR
ncbi:MAG: toll/interleukin-1 receptor domain-containing protein [Rhodothermales bacterium]|nr:toll/interleukin-1 receptor domain-containing protein [Rhodothermales bacterium]MBO6781053.1 toll/interleukin-1 receptor domain-containing protein [Rhodothermales bacterium]